MSQAQPICITRYSLTTYSETRIGDHLINFPILFTLERSEGEVAGPAGAGTNNQLIIIK